MAEPDLKALLNKAKTTPMNFAMATKGQECTGLIVKKKPIKGAEAQKLKKDTKGTDVMTGVCFGESGGVMFQFRADAPPNNDKKLKKYISDTCGLTLAVNYSADVNLSEVDDEAIDFTAIKSELNAKLAKLVKMAQAVITGEPARKTDIVAAIGEAKRLIAEINQDERPERVDHAQKALVALGRELKGKGAAPAAAPTAEDTVFVDAVLGGNADALAAFGSAFDAVARPQMTKAFGGPRGLKAVGLILNGVCGGNPAKLRTLSDALD